MKLTLSKVGTQRFTRAFLYVLTFILYISILLAVEYLLIYLQHRTTTKAAAVASFQISYLNREIESTEELRATMQDRLNNNFVKEMQNFTGLSDQPFCGRSLEWVEARKKQIFSSPAKILKLYSKPYSWNIDLQYYRPMDYTGTDDRIFHQITSNIQLKIIQYDLNKHFKISHVDEIEYWLDDSLGHHYILDSGRGDDWVLVRDNWRYLPEYVRHKVSHKIPFSFILVVYKRRENFGLWMQSLVKSAEALGPNKAASLNLCIACFDVAECRQMDHDIEAVFGWPTDQYHVISLANHDFSKARGLDECRQYLWDTYGANNLVTHMDVDIPITSHFIARARKYTIPHYTIYMPIVYYFQRNQWKPAIYGTGIVTYAAVDGQRIGEYDAKWYDISLGWEDIDFALRLYRIPLSAVRQYEKEMRHLAHPRREFKYGQEEVTVC